MEEYIQVLTTTDSREEAERISEALLVSRLAACVQVIGPISSTYWWKGRIESAQEWLCIAKSKSSLYSDLEAAIKRAHSYQTPEITAVPIVAGSRDYLDWMDAELKST